VFIEPRASGVRFGSSARRRLAAKRGRRSNALLGNMSEAEA
jgi:hypothetical protein